MSSFGFGQIGGRGGQISQGRGGIPSAGGYQKYLTLPTPLDLERGTSKMVPNKNWVNKLGQKMFLEKLKQLKDGTDKEPPNLARAEAWLWRQTQLDFENEQQTLESTAQVEYINEFICWLQGKSKWNHKKVTPWGKNPLVGDSIKQYILDFAMQKTNYRLELERLRADPLPPSDIDTAWIYWKYLVSPFSPERFDKDDFEWDVRHIDQNFLPDFEYWIRTREDKRYEQEMRNRGNLAIQDPELAKAYDTGIPKGDPGLKCGFTAKELEALAEEYDYRSEVSKIAQQIEDEKSEKRRLEVERRRQEALEIRRAKGFLSEEEEAQYIRRKEFLDNDEQLLKDSRILNMKTNFFREENTDIAEIDNTLPSQLYPQLEIEIKEEISQYKTLVNKVRAIFNETEETFGKKSEEGDVFAFENREDLLKELNYLKDFMKSYPEVKEYENQYNQLPETKETDFLKFDVRNMMPSTLILLLNQTEADIIEETISRIANIDKDINKKRAFVDQTYWNEHNPTIEDYVREDRFSIPAKIAILKEKLKVLADAKEEQRKKTEFILGYPELEITYSQEISLPEIQRRRNLIKEIVKFTTETMNKPLTHDQTLSLGSEDSISLAGKLDRMREIHKMEIESRNIIEKSIQKSEMELVEEDPQKLRTELDTLFRELSPLLSQEEELIQIQKKKETIEKKIEVSLRKRQKLERFLEKQGQPVILNQPFSDLQSDVIRIKGQIETLQKELDSGKAILKELQEIRNERQTLISQFGYKIRESLNDQLIPDSELLKKPSSELASLVKNAEPLIFWREEYQQITKEFESLSDFKKKLVEEKFKGEHPLEEVGKQLKVSDYETPTKQLRKIIDDVNKDIEKAHELLLSEPLTQMRNQEEMTSEEARDIIGKEREEHKKREEIQKRRERAEFVLQQFNILTPVKSLETLPSYSIPTKEGDIFTIIYGEIIDDLKDQLDPDQLQDLKTFLSANPSTPEKVIPEFQKKLKEKEQREKERIEREKQDEEKKQTEEKIILINKIGGDMNKLIKKSLPDLEQQIEKNNKAIQNDYNIMNEKMIQLGTYQPDLFPEIVRRSNELALLPMTQESYLPGGIRYETLKNSLIELIHNAKENAITLFHDNPLALKELNKISEKSSDFTESIKKLYTFIDLAKSIRPEEWNKYGEFYNPKLDKSSLVPAKLRLELEEQISLSLYLQDEIKKFGLELRTKEMMSLFQKIKNLKHKNILELSMKQTERFLTPLSDSNKIIEDIFKINIPPTEKHTLETKKKKAKGKMKARLTFNPMTYEKKEEESDEE